MTETTHETALPRIRRRWKVLHAKKGWHLAIRSVQWAAVSLVGVWLLYVLVANAVLRSAWARHKVNESPQTLQVEYATAWTIWPGIFHMTKVVGYGQFTNFEYAGQIDRLRINVGMVALLHHKVALDIHARGIALQGKSPNSVKPADPVIAPPVPLHEVAAPPVPVVDESLAKWTIDVGLEITDGRELWVDAVRYKGPIEAKASMSTTPNRSFEIKSFRVDAEDGEVLVGPKTALPHLHARIDVKLDPVDPRGVDVGAFNRLTVDATVGGTLGEMSFVQDIAPLPVKFRGDGGRFGVQGRLEHGHLVAPGVARVSNEGIWVGFAGTGVRGAVEAEGHLEASPDGPVAHLTAEVRKGEVTTAKGATFVVIPVTRSKATATHLDLSNPKSMRFVFGARVPSAVIPHLSVLDAFIARSDVKITEGSMSGSGVIAGDFPKGALKGGPAWVNRMLGIGPYVADAIGTFGKETKIDLIDTRAHAENFPTQPHTRVRATYDGTHDPPSWRTAIEFGILAVGIERSGTHTSVQLLEVAKWFDRATGLERPRPNGATRSRARDD